MSPTAPALPPATVNGVPTYQGTFGTDQATRLLFRAGFGPRQGQSTTLAAKGLISAVESLINPGPVSLQGPAPTGSYLVNGQFAPESVFGHIHLEFLDLCVRSSDSLGQRLALILHDWFGVSEGDVEPRLVRNHLNLLKTYGRGSFRTTLSYVMSDPAMLRFLNGVANAKVSPNENFGREVMELFSLGADRGAYTETDVRENARALTGFRMDWDTTQRSHNFRYDPTFHDDGGKTLFAGKPYQRSGNLNPWNSIDAVIDHALHPSFLVTKLWSYFIPTPPSADTQAALEALYRGTGESLTPVIRAILMHPDLYNGPTMVKPPVVYAASLLRARGAGLEDDAWIWLLQFAGQLVGRPPNVSGWNDKAWLTTGTHAYRWQVAQNASRTGAATPDSYSGRTNESPGDAITAALKFWGYPAVNGELMAALNAVAQITWSPNAANDTYWWRENFLANRQNTLRQMIVASPDAQVS